MKKTESRRSFLGSVGGSVVATSALALGVAGQSQPELNASTNTSSSSVTDSPKGYQLTENVRRYYETAMS
jgi:hypothetical protein